MPDDPDAPLLTAAGLLAWRRAGSGAAPPRIPGAAILTHQRSLLPRRMPWRRDRSLDCFSFDARPLPQDGPLLALVRGVGAPATAIALEELAASGTQRVVALDIGASIDESVASGSIVLAESALACDGTSRHYQGVPRSFPDEALTNRLTDAFNDAGIAFARGTVASTDAIYRETPSFLDEARAQGAVMVDMETASVFAVAAALGLQAACVLVAADELHDQWRPPSDMSRIQAALRQVLAAATLALRP